MTTLEILQIGRDRVARGWVQNTNATDAVGHCVDADDPSAVAWCLIGAIDPPIVSVDWQAYAPYAALWEALEQAFRSGPLSNYNDLPTTTQADIVALFDRAIEEQRK